MTDAGRGSGQVGKGRVLITRPADQAGGVAAALAAAGFDPVVVPTVQIAAVEDLNSLDDALRRVDAYRWAVFSSANAARVVGERAAALGVPPAAWSATQILAGPATARALAGVGLRAARTISPFGAREVLAALAAEDVRGARIMLPRAEAGREEVGAGLRARGAVVDELAVYRTVPVSESAALVEELERGVSAALFFSPSAVRGFKAALSDPPLYASVTRALTVACIGGTTAAEAARCGLEVHVVAPDTTVESLVAALAAHAAAQRVRRGEPVGAAR